MGQGCQPSTGPILPPLLGPLQGQPSWYGSFVRLFPGGGEGRELVLEAGWGLTTKGTGSRHGWAGHPISCDVDLTVPASPSGGAEHRQALEVSTVGLGGRALTVPETS